MQGVTKLLVRLFVAGLSLFLVEYGVAPLWAQQDAATIAGTVSDQAGKGVGAAAVTVKNGTATFSRAAIADTEGKFSVSGLAAGTYAVETTSPGFALNTRLGVTVAADATENLSITLNV